MTSSSGWSATISTASSAGRSVGHRRPSSVSSRRRRSGLGSSGVGPRVLVALGVALGRPARARRSSAGSPRSALGGSAASPSNSSVISTSPSSPPVQRTVSSPSGVDLVEGDRALAEQLQQRQEPGHRGQRVRRSRRHSARKVIVPLPAQPVDHDRGLLAHADRRARGCARATTSSTGLGSSALAASAGELLEPEPDQHLGQQRRRTAPRGPTARG